MKIRVAGSGARASFEDPRIGRDTAVLPSPNFRRLDLLVNRAHNDT